MRIQIRNGVREDLPTVMDLIHELAEYERAADQVVTSVEDLERDGFGPNPIFEFIVAEDETGVVGFALYYTKYSTWSGPCVFLEDFIVREARRGNGIGKMLFDEVVRISKARGVRRLEWQVLDWNEPAINFYKKYNSNLDGEWLNGKLVYDQLQQFGG